MARPLGIEFTGAFYHAINRGKTGMDIYRSERDREKFFEYVGEAVTDTGMFFGHYQASNKSEFKNRKSKDVPNPV